MALRAEQQKREVVETVAGLAGERLAKTKGKAAAQFIRQFYAHVPPEDVLSRQPDELYGAALALWIVRPAKEPAGSAAESPGATATPPPGPIVEEIVPLSKLSSAELVMRLPALRGVQVEARGDDSVSLSGANPPLANATSLVGVLDDVPRNLGDGGGDDRQGGIGEPEGRRHGATLLPRRDDVGG